MGAGQDHTFYYQYDTAGNRVHYVDGIHPLTATNYVYNNLNQVTSAIDVGASVYCYYTPDGNMSGTDDGTVSHEGYTFGWSARDEIGSISYRTLSFVPSLSNAYNGGGQRCYQAGLNGYNPPPDMVYDGAKLIAEMGAPFSADNRIYVNEGSSYGSRLVVQRTGADPSYPLYDALGNVTGLTGPSGALLTWARYDAFGKVIIGTAPEPFGFGGAYGYYTSIFGFINAGHRWYWPKIGKWLSRDPLWDGGNPYTYVGDTPTMFVDPMGLAGWNVNDIWWDITHAGEILRQVPQADIEVYESGYFKCYAKCMFDLNVVPSALFAIDTSSLSSQQGGEVDYPGAAIGLAKDVGAAAYAQRYGHYMLGAARWRTNWIATERAIWLGGKGYLRDAAAMQLRLYSTRLAQASAAKAAGTGIIALTLTATSAYCYNKCRSLLDCGHQ